MDTNVFISHLKRDDPCHPHARVIVEKLKADEVQAETSVLTLVEAASVGSRLYRRAMPREDVDRERKVFIIKTLRKLADLTTRFIHLAGDSLVVVKSVQADMPAIFNEALLLSLQMPLRTLDLMHIAAARRAREMHPELGAFVTGDKELLSRKEELHRLMGLPVLSPEEYVKAMGLQSASRR